jgi:hypothetical protein
MLGLNDPWVGRNGRVLGTRPGHQRVATASYLLDRQVNLVIGHPKVHDLSAGVRKYTVQNASFSMAEVVPTHFPKGARVIEIPLDEATAVHVLYFVQNPAVEKAIRQFNLKTFPIESEEEKANKSVDHYVSPAADGG